MLVSDIPKSYFDTAARLAAQSALAMTQEVGGALPDDPFYLLIVQGAPAKEVPERCAFDTDIEFVEATIKEIRKDLLGEYGDGNYKAEIPGIGFSPYQIAHIKARTSLRFGLSTRTAILRMRVLREGDTRSFGSSWVTVRLTPELELTMVPSASGWRPEADLAATYCVKPALILTLTQADIIPRPLVDSPTFLLGPPTTPYKQSLLTHEGEPWAPRVGSEAKK